MPSPTTSAPTSVSSSVPKTTLLNTDVFFAQISAKLEQLTGAVNNISDLLSKMDQGVGDIYSNVVPPTEESSSSLFQLVASTKSTCQGMNNSLMGFKIPTSLYQCLDILNQILEIQVISVYSVNISYITLLFLSHFALNLPSVTSHSIL